MSSNDKVYIIDNNEGRSDKLRTILDFIGESTEVTRYGNLGIFADANPEVIILGAHESIEENLNELDSLVNQFVKIPVIVVGQKIIQFSVYCT